VSRAENRLRFALKWAIELLNEGMARPVAQIIALQVVLDDTEPAPAWPRWMAIDGDPTAHHVRYLAHNDKVGAPCGVSGWPNEWAVTTDDARRCAVCKETE